MENITHRRRAATKFHSLLRCHNCTSTSIEVGFEIYPLSNPDQRRRAFVCTRCLNRLREHFAAVRLAEQERRAK